MNSQSILSIDPSGAIHVTNIDPALLSGQR